MRLEDAMNHLGLAFKNAMAAMLSDDMTELGNMLSLQSDAENVISTIQDTTYHYVFGDLNGFKAINDNHSHAAGDAVISQVGSTIRELCDKWNFRGYRRSGDEFVLLIPEQILSNIIKELKNRFSDCSMSIGESNIKFSASFGICPMANADLKTIESRAELACQSAKQAGEQDNVCIWTDALSVDNSERRFRCKGCGTSVKCAVPQKHSNKSLHCPVCQVAASSDHDVRNSHIEGAVGPLPSTAVS